MYLKENIKQLELFSQVGEANSRETLRKKSLLFSHFLSYEKAIFIFISLLVIFIFAFSLGVEKGKKINKIIDTYQGKDINEKISEKMATPPSENILPKALPSKATSDSIRIKKEDRDRKRDSGPKAIPKRYTIQVATYSNQKYAQKELASLKKKGYDTFIISKGGLTLVCVGNFLKKEKAGPFLVELKKRYQDCFVRKL